MKQITPLKFNYTKKFENNSLKSAFSFMQNTNSTPRGNNKSVICLNFPKLYSKLRYITRNKTNSDNKSMISDTNSNSSEIKTNNNNNNVENINSAIKILHYPDLTQKQLSTNTLNILPNIFPKNISSRIHQYKYLNSFNKITGFSPMFLFKPKKTVYKKYLSDNYRKNNEQIINKINMEYKQKNDSILNAVKYKDGIFMKGMNYKKYYFFPHEKMNILAFHQKLMEENLRRFENRRITFEIQSLFFGSEIRVDKSIRFNGNTPEIQLPKTKAGIRNVPMLSILQPYLRKPKQQIIGNASGKVMTEQSFSRCWESYILHLSKSAGHPVNIRPHDLRHTYATACIKSGVDIKTLQDNLGHSDVQTTLNIYSHVFDSMKEASAHQVEAYYSELKKEK